MIDIHTHVIPLVDDGSRSLDESIALIQREIENGVDTIVCTPHFIAGKYSKPKEEIIEQYNLLNAKVKELNLPVKLLLGQEIYYTTRIDVLKLLNNNELLTMDNSKYVLLEFSFTHEPDDIAEILYNFSCFDYKVIIAHVERYNWISFDKVQTMINEGALIQVNADSLLKLAGFKQYFFAKKLIKKKKVDLIASDTHFFRPSNLKKVKDKLKDNHYFEIDFHA